MFKIGHTGNKRASTYVVFSQWLKVELPLSTGSPRRGIQSAQSYVWYFFRKRRSSDFSDGEVYASRICDDVVVVVGEKRSAVGMAVLDPNHTGVAKPLRRLS